MRRSAAALLALATLMLGAAPLAAQAQDKPAPITKDQRDRGMKEAPAAVQKAGIACTVTDAAYVGSTNDGNAYEVACQQGLGYVVIAGKAPKAYDCVATTEQKTLACRLPANADPKQGLKPAIASAGVTCTPTAARYLGSSATTTVYEVACQEGPGFILQAPAAGAATASTLAIPCIQAPAKMACTLTSKAQNDAYLASLVAKSGRACQVSGSRYMGTDSTSGVAYYEVGCGAQPGFVVGANKAGGFDHVLTCGQAQNLAGGCTLTSAAAVAGQQTADYTRMAKAAGFDCDVSKSRTVGQDSDHDEVVELACSNRPDGAVAMFPGRPAGRTRIYDCISAGHLGPTAVCQLSSLQPLYVRMTAALYAKGRKTCQVSGARYIGTNGGGDFVELACADGKPGFVVQLGTNYVAKDILSCGEAKQAAMTCQLPTNLAR